MSEPVTVFATLTPEEHAVMRRLASEQDRPLGDIVRDAIAEYVGRNPVTEEGSKVFYHVPTLRRS